MTTKITKSSNQNNKNENLKTISEMSNKTKQFVPPNLESNTDPFNMIIVGFTNCGKTHYLFNLLEQEYMNYFDYVFLICPTYEWNKTYRRWKYDKDENFFVIQFEQDSVESFLKEIVDFAKGTNSLIILDDCASGKFVKGRTSELVKLGFSARHYRISAIVLTQQLTSIAKPYRENISRLVSFYNPNKNDMQIIFDKYLGTISKEERDEIYKKLQNIKYCKLDISLRHPYHYSVN